MMNANHRLHFAKKAEQTKKIRDAAAAAARSTGVPALPGAWVMGYVHPPKNYAVWDPANYHPMAKAALDGLVDAGVFADDSHQFVAGPDMRPAPKVSGGQLVLVIMPDVWRCRCGHDGLEHVGGAGCVRPGCGCGRWREGWGGPAG